MPALVLEGGTFRPMFSCGVMDALVDCGVEFPYIIGVSAGISNASSYVSKQVGRNLEIMQKYRHDKRYLGLRNLFTEDKSLFGRKFIYQDIPDKLLPFDVETYKKSNAEFVVGVTNAQTGKAEYINERYASDGYILLQATCALPLAFPPIVYRGTQYYDGGLVDSIPAKKAIADGHEKMLIVLTRTKDYVKEESSAYKLAAKILKSKYPKVAELLLTRHTRYNAEVEYCNELERQGRAVILRPTEEVQIGSFEGDMEKIERIYKFGYDLAMENMDKIKALFE
ncbi:MAG: patatin family protein [Clostridia bacterium]|nr:patatin family protein [Clostridia bacterium]